MIQTKFDEVIYHLLSENDVEYDFDIKKSFFVLPGYDSEFVRRLTKLSETEDEPLEPSGLPPSPRPMYQVGEMAGKVSSPSQWASAILNYYDSHDDTNVNMVAILRNCRVKPNDQALFNFYQDIKHYFGDITEYKIPEKETGVERAKTVKDKSTEGIGSIFNAVFRNRNKVKRKPFRLGPTIK